MITLLVALAVGASAGAIICRLGRNLFDHPTLARRNVRGVDVATAGGLIFPLVLIPLWVAIEIHSFGQWSLISPKVGMAVRIAILPVMIFALLGLVDDLLALGDDRGFRGHIRALAQGRLTTGGIKLIGGGLAAIGVVLANSSAGLAWWEIAMGSAVVALGANLANLFDRAPGRVTKVSAVAFVALVLTASGAERAALGPSALVLGLAFGLLIPELRERIMLGDTGANPLGAILGLGVVLTTSTVVSVGVLLILLALNLASEKISFSAVIARNAVLRWFDDLGRLPT